MLTSSLNVNVKGLKSAIGRKRTCTPLVFGPRAYRGPSEAATGAHPPSARASGASSLNAASAAAAGPPSSPAKPSATPNAATSAVSAAVSDLLSPAYLWSAARRHPQQIATGTAALLLCASCNLAAPVLSGFLFECLVQGLPAQRFQSLFAVFFAVYFLEPVMTQVYIRSFTDLGEKVLARARGDVFQALLARRIEFFDSHSAAELTSLVGQQLGVLREVGLAALSRDRGPRALLESVGSVCIIFTLSWMLAPVLCLVILCSSVGAAIYSRKAKKVFADDVDSTMRMAEVAQEAFGNIRTVKSNRCESLEERRFAEFSERSRGSGVQMGRAKGALEGLNRGSIHVSLLALYAWGGVLASRGLLPVHALLACIGFTFSLVFSTQGVVNTMADVRKASAALQRIRGVLAENSSKAATEATNGAHSAAPGGYSNGSSSSPRVAHADAAPAPRLSAREAAGLHDLELQEVSFSYPRQAAPVLHNVSVPLRRGTVTALVGRSGAGKSTVASLLARFYDPTSGSLLLGGRDVRGLYTPEQWADAVAIVPQDISLFSATVHENIAYGRRGECTRAEVEAAARASNAHEFIEALPQGYDTVLGPRGVSLSGGQRQRLAIARALVKEAPVLVLDEATAALDSVSETLVQAALERLLRGRTVLVIAHRLSTVQRADSIVVLREGRVVEHGSHGELLAAGGEYAKLVSSQALALTS